MKVTKRSCDVTPRSKYQRSKGHPWSPCASNLVQFRLLLTKLRHFEKNGTRNFSLIGRHLESVSRTIPVFKHTLAPSEKWPTQEISVRFGPFLSSYHVNIARCNLCARAKVKGHIKLKIEENSSEWLRSDNFMIVCFMIELGKSIFSAICGPLHENLAWVVCPGL